MKSLTPVEQNALAIAAKAGDRSAVSKLLAFCERDVLAIVGKWRVSDAERQDLAQVARMSIIESAIPGFNPNKGYQFRFYAALWARTEVKRARNVGSSVVVVNVRTGSSDLSLDVPAGFNHEGDPCERDWSDLTASDAPTPEEYAISGDNTERVRAAMERIIASLRDDADRKYDKVALCRDLVYKRLLSESPMNLAVLADQYGVARQTCRNLELALTKRLRGILVEA